MTVLGTVMMFLGSILGGLWWLAGAIAYFNNGQGLFRFAGFFLLPNLIVPFVIDGLNAAGWYGWLAAWLTLFWGGALLASYGEEREGSYYR